MRGRRFANLFVGASALASYSDVFADQLTKFIASRGFDISPQPPQHIPRTTISDVHGLANYWNDALARGPGERPGDLGGLDRARRVWLVEMGLAIGTPDGSAVYRRNADFWHAMLTLSTELAALSLAPTSWELAKDAVADSAKRVADKIGHGALEIGKYVAVATGVIGGAIIIGELIAASVKGRR